MHKDVVFHKLKKFWRSEIRNHTLNDKLGLEACFGTLDEVFPDANNQPIIYSGNLQHVLELAQKKETPVDVLAGICMFGYGRINAQNDVGRFDLWVLPKELDKGSDWRLRDYASLPRGWQNLPLELDVSAAYLEPTFGRVAKIFNIFEAARHFSGDVSFMLPSEEYCRVRTAVARKAGLPDSDLDKLRKAHEGCVKRYRQAITSIQKCFFPDVSARVLSSSQEDIKTGVDRIAQNDAFRKAVHALKKFSYHQKINASEECLEEERRYLSLFIADHSAHKDPSKILILNARDIDSFVLQAMCVYDTISSAKAFDRIAFIGVGGGPAITRNVKPKDLFCPLDLQEASYDDYFGLAPVQVISPAECLSGIEAKLDFPHAERSNTSPVFAYLNVFAEYLKRDDLMQFLDAWKNGRADEVQAKKNLLSVLAELKAGLAIETYK